MNICTHSSPLRRKDPQKLKFRISECPRSGLSLRGGGRGLSQTTTNLAPGSFLWENKIKIEPKETLSWFDSPPTCCIYLATWNLSVNPVKVWNNDFECTLWSWLPQSCAAIIGHRRKRKRIKSSVYKYALWPRFKLMWHVIRWTWVRILVALTTSWICFLVVGV